MIETFKTYFKMTFFDQLSIFPHNATFRVSEPKFEVEYLRRLSGTRLSEITDTTLVWTAYLYASESAAEPRC